MIDKHSLSSMPIGTGTLKSMAMEERDGNLVSAEGVNKTEKGKGSGDEVERVHRGHIQVVIGLQDSRITFIKKAKNMIFKKLFCAVWRKEMNLEQVLASLKSSFHFNFPILFI